MKQRSTTPVSARSIATKVVVMSVVVIMAVAAPLQMIPQVAHANDFEARIKSLQNEIDQYQAKAGELSQKAAGLQGEVDRLSNEKAMIQRQIDLKQAEHDQLVKNIADNEKKIQDNQDALGDTIADLYVDDNISELEMLASSQNISEYVDKQEYRSVIRDQLTRTIDTIKRAKQELEKQKLDVERNLEDQKGQRTVLAQKEAEQVNLLAQTRGEEASYVKLSADRIAKRNEVQRQQQAAIQAAVGNINAVAGDPGKGGYPANLANSDYDNPIVDPWGMYSRQCVSYTAWKVFQKNNYMPYWGGRGNANQWPANARAAGIHVDTTPRKGSVGVIMAGQYGHVVWVEDVNSDGTINISQYNYFNAGGPGWGHYSEMYNVSPGAYDYYIYF